MGTQGAGRKRSTKKERSTAEDDALNLIAREAEARLAAKRAARAEAREIRMKELERQQKEIFQVQKKYYGLNAKVDERVDNRWGDIEQWMEDSERYSRSSQIQMLSDDDERMSVGSRGSVRSDLDAVGAYGGGDSPHKKSKKKKKHKHKDRDRNSCDDEYSVMSSRSSRLSDESRVSRSSRLDLTSSRLSDDSRMSRASRLDLQPTSYVSSDLYSLNGLSSRNPGSTFNGNQGSLYEDSLCSGSRRLSSSSGLPLDYTSYRGSRSRSSSRASSARASPVDNCGSVASFLRSSSGLPRDLDDITIPDFTDVEDRDYLEKGSRAASALTAGTLTSLGGTSSRRGSGETALTLDADTSIREIKEIHELKDQIQDVESKYTQNLKEAKDALAEVEEKYRKAMVSNAQLDNEKNNLMYQVDTLKDSLTELEELLSESRREYEEKVKEFEREKYAHGVLQFQFNEMKETLKQSEELLNEIRQLRLKEEGFVREISDLQETVEWKDKKIGALERQKEYTDAIRTERDELREEVVKLKDILKKHGIVLGPDLNINGDIGEAEVDGSSGGDAARQPAQDSQTSPTEGNSVLGNTEETQLRSNGEEEVDGKEQQEKLKEEAKTNQLSSDSLCNVADVSTLETSHEDQPTEEQQRSLPREDDSAGESGFSKDLNVDVNDHPVTEAKDMINSSPEIVTSVEENVIETETPESVNLEETSSPDLGETESEKPLEEQEKNQEDAEESNLCKEESPQQEVAKEAVHETETNSASSKPEPQQEPENTEEAENDETEEISSKPQAAAATSGKKKKKKKRGKKKGGNQNKDGAEKENSKKEHDVESDKRDNGSTSEPPVEESVTETLKETKTEQVKEQDVKETEEVGAAQAEEPNESLHHKDESNADHVTNEHDVEQTLTTETAEKTEAAELGEIVSHSETPKEITQDPLVSEQNEEQSLETETVETGDVRAAETVSPVETPEELRTDALTDEQNKEETLETEKVENKSITSTETNVSAESTDRCDREGTNSEDILVSGDVTTNAEDHSELEVADGAKDEVLSADETQAECTANNPETNSEDNTEGDQHVASNGDITADQSESKDSEVKDVTSVVSPSTDDLTDHSPKTLSDSESPSEPSVASDAQITVCDKDPEELTEAVNAEDEPGIESEQEHTPPSPDDGDSGLNQDEAEKEELSRELREVEDSVESDGCDRNTEQSQSEAEAHVEHADDVESQTLECVEESDESNTKVSLETDETEPVTDSLKEVTETEAAAAAEEPEHQTSQNAEGSEMSPCPLTERLHESREDKSEDDPSQAIQQGSDEEDGEDEEGQSFDFDDMDIEAAVSTDPSKNEEQEEVEEAVEVLSDGSNNESSEPSQSHVEMSEEKQTAAEENQGDAVDKGLNQDSSVHDEAAADEAKRTVEEGKVLNVTEPSVVVENVETVQVEEGLDAVKHELNSADLVLPKSTDQVAGSKEPPQSGKDAKKNGKKNKGKGKEECKMS